MDLILIVRDATHNYKKMAASVKTVNYNIFKIVITGGVLIKNTKIDCKLINITYYKLVNNNS